MAFFKTKQYEILGAVVNRVNTAIDQIKQNELPESHLEKPTRQLMASIIGVVVDELRIEFAKDNRLFNETLFRAQCGNLISKQHAINESDRG